MLADIVFLLDVDNTLLDNDRAKAYLEEQIRSTLGQAGNDRFWELYEDVRATLGAVSVPLTLERLRRESRDVSKIDDLGERLYSTPFADFVYPGALDLLHWLRERGLPVILSDGDPWFQAKKITDAGFGMAVGGNVLIFPHKEGHVEDIRKWYPAPRYVAVDDKAQLLGLLKRGFGPPGAGLETIWVRQGHYAQQGTAGVEQPDRAVDRIDEALAAIESLQ